METPSGRPLRNDMARDDRQNRMEQKNLRFFMRLKWHHLENGVKLAISRMTPAPPDSVFTAVEAKLSEFKERLI